MLHNSNKNIKKKNPELYKSITKILDYLKKYKISLSDKSLIDVYNNKDVDKLIIGIDNVDQLRKNINTIKNKSNKSTRINISHNLNFKYLDTRKW